MLVSRTNHPKVALATYFQMLEIIDKSKVHGIMQYKWNIPQVIDGLKKLHLLESNFTYKEWLE